MYVTYSFYRDIYGSVDYMDESASIPDISWDYYESRASEHLDRYKRIYTVTIPPDLAGKQTDGATDRPYAEAMAICAMAEALANFDIVRSGTGGPVASASIGSVSVGYGSGVSDSIDLSPKGLAKELYRCACRYLDICRGVG